MTTAWQRNSNRRDTKAAEAGQALVELAVAVLVMAVLAFGLIDFGRAIYDQEVLSNLSREGSALAAHGTTPTAAAAAVVQGSDLNNFNSTSTTQGLVIVTVVQNTGSAGSPHCVITAQVSNGGLAATSKIGTNGGIATGLASCSGATPIPQPNSYVYATEVFYSYSTITPIGKLLTSTMPSQLYDAAYFSM